MLLLSILKQKFSDLSTSQPRTVERPFPILCHRRNNTCDDTKIMKFSKVRSTSVNVVIGCKTISKFENSKRLYAGYDNDRYSKPLRWSTKVVGKKSPYTSGKSTIWRHSVTSMLISKKKVDHGWNKLLASGRKIPVRSDKAKLSKLDWGITQSFCKLCARWLQAATNWHRASTRIC